MEGVKCQSNLLWHFTLTPSASEEVDVGSQKMLQLLEGEWLAEQEALSELALVLEQKLLLLRCFHTLGDHLHI